MFCRPANLEEVTQNLASQMLPSGFFVVHDATASRQDDVSELTRWEQRIGPPFDIVQLDVEPGRDDTGLVQTAGQVHHHLAGSVIVDDFELSDVAMLHHHGQELDHDFAVRPDQDLAFSTLLGIVDALERIG